MASQTVEIEFDSSGHLISDKLVKTFSAKEEELLYIINKIIYNVRPEDMTFLTMYRYFNEIRSNIDIANPNTLRDYVLGLKQLQWLFGHKIALATGVEKTAKVGQIATTRHGKSKLDMNLLKNNYMCI